MPDDVVPIRRALVSVSDKSNLEALAASLSAWGTEVLSTGGTFEALASFGCRVRQVSEVTGFPEILGGRVKTLHPKIHGGILARATAEHMAEIERHGIAPIDLVVVNLYPFQRTVARPDVTFEEAMENVDIGGPTMVRAAAKTWERVTVVVDPEDYARLDELVAACGGVPAKARRDFARKAFAHTAAYDAAIANWLEAQATDDDDVPARIFLAGASSRPLRYGENPHQKARFVPVDLGDPAGLADARIVQGKPLSYNNLMDAGAALELARDLRPLGVGAAVFKHVSPCGVAVGGEDAQLADVFRRAREADAESAFGGIVALTHAVDRATAEAIVESFLEVVVAPSVADDAREVLAAKKNLRVLEVPRMHDVAPQPPLRVRTVPGGLLVQREDRIGVRPRDGRVVTKTAPSEDAARDLELAWVVVEHVRSNAIVLVRDGVTVGIGGGQTSRVEASRQAVRRAGERARGAVLASDAFFPFRDGVDAAAAAGVVAIVQPGGSRRDAEVVEAADEHGIAMIFTGERHFRH